MTMADFELDEDGLPIFREVSFCEEQQLIMFKEEAENWSDRTARESFLLLEAYTRTIAEQAVQRAIDKGKFECKCEAVCPTPEPHKEKKSKKRERTSVCVHNKCPIICFKKRKSSYIKACKHGHWTLFEGINGKSTTCQCALLMAAEIESKEEWIPIKKKVKVNKKK